MKARRFLATLLAVALSLLGLGAGAWTAAIQRSPLRQAHQLLSIPEAAHFIPRRAPLTLHWFSGPDWPTNYAASVAPMRRREEAADALRHLRDGVFASAGLDYPSELAGWLGGQISLSVLEPRDGAAPSGWLLALRSRDEEGARKFLQRFWQIRSLAGADLTVSKYRGMGLISGRGALVGPAPQPLATALINDRLVLIASGRGVLEEGLDVSQIDELNLASDEHLRTAVSRLGTGVALLTARAGALSRWLALPRPLAEASGQATLVAALRPHGRSLDAEALLPWQGASTQERTGAQGWATHALGQRLTVGDQAFESLSLVQDPSSLLQAARGEVPLESEEPPSPWGRALGPVLRAALNRDAGPLLRRLAQADHGSLLLAWRDDGWLAGTDPDQPSLRELSEQLRLDGLAESPLVLDGLPLRIWSRLVASSGRGRGAELQATLAGARLEGDEGQAWWSNRLALLREQGALPHSTAAQVRHLQELGGDLAPFALSLGDGAAASLLNRWLPWTLVQGLAAQPLASVVDGLDLLFDPHSTDAGQAPIARLRARVRFV